MIVAVAHQPTGLNRAIGADLPEGLAVSRHAVIAGQKVGIRGEFDTAVEVQQVQLLATVRIVAQVAGPIVAVLPVKIGPIAAKVGLGSPARVIFSVVTVETEGLSRG